MLVVRVSCYQTINVQMSKMSNYQGAGNLARVLIMIINTNFLSSICIFISSLGRRQSRCKIQAFVLILEMLTISFVIAMKYNPEYSSGSSGDEEQLLNKENEKGEVWPKLWGKTEPSQAGDNSCTDDARDDPTYFSEINAEIYLHEGMIHILLLAHAVNLYKQILDLILFISLFISLIDIKTDFRFISFHKLVFFYLLVQINKCPLMYQSKLKVIRNFEDCSSRKTGIHYSLHIDYHSCGRNCTR